MYTLNMVLIILFLHVIAVMNTEDVDYVDDFSSAQMVDFDLRLFFLST